MPITKSVKKSLRASERKAEINRPLKSKARTMVKKMRTSPSEENLKAAYSALDKAVKKKIIHKGKASRLKSRLAKLLANTKEKTKKTGKK